MEAVSKEGQEVIQILSTFTQFKDISKTSIKDLNQAINNAIKELGASSDPKAISAFDRIRILSKSMPKLGRNSFEEAKKMGVFIGYHPDCD